MMKTKFPAEDRVSLLAKEVIMQNFVEKNDQNCLPII